jgi:hypothetical protein
MHRILVDEKRWVSEFAVSAVVGLSYFLLTAKAW